MTDRKVFKSGAGRRKSRLIYVIAIFGTLLLIIVLFLISYKGKHVNRDNSFECISYWKDILERRESDVNYITKWFEYNPGIQLIYNTQGGDVCFEKEDECLINFDSRIAEFVKENDIHIEKYVDEEVIQAGSVISFSHEFFERKMAGRYCLMYIKDEKVVSDSFEKIKDNYYCQVIFYDE